MADALDTTTQTTEQGASNEWLDAARTEVARTQPTQGGEAAVDAKPGAEAGADTDAGAEVAADYSGLTLPEGYRADDPVFAEAVKLFDSEEIAPETAQKLIDYTVNRDKEIARAVNEHSAASWTKQTTDWRATSEREFSPEALGNARTALAQVFDRQTVTYLESLGFTNHPGLIRGMVKVANTIKDDSFVGGNAGRGNGAMDPKSLYPNSQHN
ncbi:MAG: hypothetical protein JWQ58_1221 [Reyranella sp.]|nr:hypothetical protein [Reyranella sp.]